VQIGRLLTGAVPLSNPSACAKAHLSLNSDASCHHNKPLKAPMNQDLFNFIRTYLYAAFAALLFASTFAFLALPHDLGNHSEHTYSALFPSIAVDMPERT
jgi:hypothetical protein